MPKKKTFQIGKSLTEGLTETVMAAHSQRGDLSVEAIPLFKIDLDSGNPRELNLKLSDIFQALESRDPLQSESLAEKYSLNSLVNSIKEQGVLNPILVYKCNERYRLIAGERRTLASAVAGKETIQAKIFDRKPNPLKLSLLQWVENMEREDLSLWERLRNIEKIVNAFIDEKKISLDMLSLSELSQLLGCAKTQAKNYKDFLKADNYLRELIRKNELSNLEKVAFIANIPSEQDRSRIIKECLKGATLEQMKKQLNKELPNSKGLEAVSAKKGRKAKKVQLGTTKNIKVAKYLLSTVLSDSLFHSARETFSDIDWEDFGAISTRFQQVLKFLEQRI